MHRIAQTHVFTQEPLQKTMKPVGMNLIEHTVGKARPQNRRKAPGQTRRLPRQLLQDTLDLIGTKPQRPR